MDVCRTHKTHIKDELFIRRAPYQQLLLSSKPQLCSLLYLSVMDGDTGFLSGRHVE